MPAITQQEINNLPPPPQEWLDEMKKEANDKLLYSKMFGVNPVLNYYNIRSAVLQPYYEADKGFQSRADTRLIYGEYCGGGNTWSNCDFIPKDITVGEFVDEWMKGHPEDINGFGEGFVCKTWAEMKIDDFVYYFLEKLKFNHCGAHKKDFFSTMINYYFVKFHREHPDENMDWVTHKLGGFCEDYCKINNVKYLGFVKKVYVEKQPKWKKTLEELHANGKINEEDFQHLSSHGIKFAEFKYWKKTGKIIEDTVERMELGWC